MENNFYPKRQLSKDLQEMAHAIIGIHKRINKLSDICDNLTKREMESKRRLDERNHKESP